MQNMPVCLAFGCQAKHLQLLKTQQNALRTHPLKSGQNRRNALTPEKPSWGLGQCLRQCLWMLTKFVEESGLISNGSAKHRHTHKHTQNPAPLPSALHSLGHLSSVGNIRAPPALGLGFRTHLNV